MIQQLDSRRNEKASNCIAVKKSEVSQLVDTAYYEMKGEGAKKLSKQMSQIYRGLSRRIIQHGLNSMKQQQKAKLDTFFKIKRLSGQSGHQKYKKEIKWILLAWLAYRLRST